MMHGTTMPGAVGPGSVQTPGFVALPQTVEETDWFDPILKQNDDRLPCNIHVDESSAVWQVEYLDPTPDILWSLRVLLQTISHFL